jgi:hypothetical protein
VVTRAAPATGDPTGGPSPGAPYLLASHVHACVAGRHVVLMDLERDKYMAVEPAHRLARWVRGWPVGAPCGGEIATEERAPIECGPAAEASPAQEGGARELLREMLAHGMLVTDPDEGRPATPVATVRPVRTLIEFDLDESPRASAGQLGRFARAWMTARLALSLRPVHSIIEAIRASRSRGSRPPPPDPAATRALVMACTRLRPLFYTVRDACVLDCLTMRHFLASYGAQPEWVFGVRTEPFDTHCWLQQGELLLNDLPDRVRQYSPILLV